MSRKIAYGGILLSLNSILLLLVNIIPINTLFLLGLASLPISIVIMEYGPKAGIIFYIGSVLLSFMIMANKAQWILYIFTFGIYGLVKYIIEKDRSFIQEYILKIIVANILIIFAYIILKQFVYIPVNIFTILIFEIAFIVYDFVYSQFIDFYNDKLRKFVKR
ncbi:MAG: hypothetical protein E6356_12355 [Terrisporobacter othiniensis]|uniref:hypothetical protein n=1 Tax=Terrisporobacter TaxID=1505652 RepID=UPI000E975E0C|nr:MULTISPECIES: hypothetical protein [Terrisporobacter]MDU4862008.1 hypothetical protein [Terrisporobacter othiniensis]MDU6995644.1 hypothetical protein [Terrisporobacter othiniensis]HBI92197.1 hypothetical protein [Terrisporobacter hibernicus]